jgi:diaminopimelate epimerase
MIGQDPEMDIFMRIFNADGSEPEMCGNGIRCVARYAYERGWAPNTRLTVRTLAGIRYPEIIRHNDGPFSVKVDMGEPILERRLIPMQGTGDNVRVKLATSFKEFEITGVSMGNPTA